MDPDVPGGLSPSTFFTIFGIAVGIVVLIGIAVLIGVIYVIVRISRRQSVDGLALSPEEQVRRSSTMRATNNLDMFAMQQQLVQQQLLQQQLIQQQVQNTLSQPPTG